MTLKERIEAALAEDTSWGRDIPALLLRDCAREIERLAGERDALKARVAELEARTAPIPGVTDGSREYEAYTLDEVTLIEAQRGKAYSRLRVTVRTMLALATNHAMLLGGDAKNYVSLPAKSGIAVLEFKARVAELEGSLRDPMAVRVNLLRGAIAAPADLVWLNDSAGPVAQIRAERDEWKAKAEATGRDLLKYQALLTKR